MKHHFPLTTVQLTAMVMGYTNSEFYADALLPRATVASPMFEWWRQPDNENFNTEDTQVGLQGEVRRITSELTKETDQTVDYALEYPIPVTSVSVAPSGIDPRKRAVNTLAYKLMLEREKIVADIYAKSSNYGTTTAISSSGDRWSNSNADVYGQLETALNKPMQRPNTMVLNQSNWSLLKNHSSMKAAINKNSGVLTKEQVADILEIERIIIPTAKYNTANPGQSGSLSSVWGSDVSLVYLGGEESLDTGMVWGATASLQNGKGTETYYEPQRGAKGAHIFKAYDQRKELVINKKSGHKISGITA